MLSSNSLKKLFIKLGDNFNLSFTKDTLSFKYEDCIFSILKAFENVSLKQAENLLENCKAKSDVIEWVFFICFKFSN